MSFFRRLIFGAPGSPPTNSAHSQQTKLTLENLQLTNTVHVLDFVGDETITALVLEIVKLTKTQKDYEVKSCEEYLKLILRQNQRYQKHSHENIQKCHELFEMKVGLKVIQIETLEASFELVKNVLTNGKDVNSKEIANLTTRITQNIINSQQKPASKARHYDKVLEENQTLKSKILDLEEERGFRVKKEKEAEKKFIIDLHRLVDAEVSRVQSVFKSLTETTQRTSAENEKLQAKIRDQENLMNHLTKEINEKKQGLLVEVQHLSEERNHLETSLQKAETDSQELSKKLQTLKENLNEQMTLGMTNEKDYDEKLSAFLKNTEEFKQGIYKRNETRARRLEEDNEKLRIENHEFRFKILDMDLKEIFRSKPAMTNKKRVQL